MVWVNAGHLCIGSPCSLYILHVLHMAALFSQHTREFQIYSEIPNLLRMIMAWRCRSRFWLIRGFREDEFGRPPIPRLVTRGLHR